MHMRSTMSPQHPRWTELLHRLDQTKRCLRTTAHTRAILETMEGIDVAVSLQALADLGARCDCAILYGLSDAAEWALAAPA